MAACNPFDIVLIDEAHACPRQKPTSGLDANPEYGQLYRTVDEVLRVKASALWLATATPMQLEKVEAWDLLRLMHRAGAFQDDPRLTFEYYDCLADLISQWASDAYAEGILSRVALGSLRDTDLLLWRGP